MHKNHLVKFSIHLWWKTQRGKKGRIFNLKKSTKNPTAKIILKGKSLNVSSQNTE